MGSVIPALAALVGSLATAVAIFAGGLAVERTRWLRDRAGMALALAGAIDALLALIETREMTVELNAARGELEAGRPYEFGSLIEENAPFRAITMAYANRLGDLGGDLPFRVARFLAYSQGLQHDLARLDRNRDRPRVQAMVIGRMEPTWRVTETLGRGLVADLRALAERSR